MDKLKLFTYTDDKSKEQTIKVKPVSIFSTGLMFKKNSQPLLFDLKHSQRFSIFSLFCKPFRAIWLDDKKRINSVYGARFFIAQNGY